MIVMLLGHRPTTTQYKEHGKISLTVLWRRLGSWRKVKAAVQRQRTEAAQ